MGNCPSGLGAWIIMDLAGERPESSPDQELTGRRIGYPARRTMRNLFKISILRSWPLELIDRTPHVDSTSQGLRGVRI